MNFSVRLRAIIKGSGNVDDMMYYNMSTIGIKYGMYNLKVA